MRIPIRPSPRTVGPVVATFLRTWMAGTRIDVETVDPRIDPISPGFDRAPRLYLAWHETLLGPLWKYRGQGIRALISRSRDGELITQVADRLGWSVIRGSSSRGGASAVRAILAERERSSDLQVSITADGPRGPRRRLKSGVVSLASAAQTPVVPIGCAFDRPHRFRSWDRFALPFPFRRGLIVFGEPRTIPRDVSKTSLEGIRLEIETEMERLQEHAEREVARVSEETQEAAA